MAAPKLPAFEVARREHARRNPSSDQDPGVLP